MYTVLTPFTINDIVAFMQFSRNQDPMILVFIILSLLVHLLLLFLVPQRTLFPPPEADTPLVVEMRPPEPREPARERELDAPVVTPSEQPRQTPAKRLGPADQEVERETAPKGDFIEDRAPSAPPAPPTPRQPPSPTPPAPEPPTDQPSAKTGIEARPGTSGPQKTAPEQATELPDKKALMAALNQAAAKSANQYLQEWRSKYREDVVEGEAVWLDMENDLLNSFFSRFRDRIYLVWNYPARAAERGEQGRCLLQVTVNKDGTLEEVVLKESSGYPLLDQEAIDAVHKAAPYGALSRYYEKETLTIFVVFQYHLTSFSSRPGDIL
ncbi:energy transducer TonB [Desulfuromonas sp. AOP6]|uniref:energy transducer TonB n=1 Tax=Desulfuromonas sp. AOP6 TaxID=1566351 RepID=UPI00127A5EDE|nr:energy transducer TonB [Desulfuromonas sp. AOP6]BCA78967.1 hypothetical protein AOP6_0754 [Desulfuromonas sp. AOP6]